MLVCAAIRVRVPSQYRPRICELARFAEAGTEAAGAQVGDEGGDGLAEAAAPFEGEAVKGVDDVVRGGTSLAGGRGSCT